MRSTGFISNVDDFGRIVVPLELRQQRCIASDDGVEVMVGAANLVLQGWQAGCVLCGDAYWLGKCRSHWLCLECVGLLRTKDRLEEQEEARAMSQEPGIW